jgi:Mlc titration factor MtfA (ptsG expression regulator)
MFWLKKWRRKRVAQKPFPKEWLGILEKNLPFYRHLPDADRAELRRHIQVFLSEKRFEGCAGLEVTDEMKVTIAAQACILLLHRKTDYYPGLYSILVYPHAFVIRRPQHIESGLFAEGPQVLLGESWRRGSVVLSWDDVVHGAADIHDGQNVVLHEFAHQIDQSGGKGDGTEVLKNRTRYLAWARVLQKDYEKLRSAALQNRHSLLRDYAATNPAEFFAVATEYFFEKPKELKRAHPELYDELKIFYHQDPLTYLP